MTPDCELLRQYAEEGDEAAFTEVVRRHVNLVYSVTLRVTRDAPSAQDVTQGVFTAMARQAKGLSSHATLAGWLHTCARYLALKAVRGEQRRRTREQEASLMHDDPAPESDWEQLRPLLDEAVGRLREHERDAVVLRFFEGLSHRDVGAALGLNENTARKRVDQALEKLRAHFARRGVTAASALLATTISAHSVQAAPADFAAGVAGVSLAGAGAAGAFGKTFYYTMKIKIAIVTAFMLAAATPVVVQHREIVRLEDQLAAATQEAASARQEAAREKQRAAQLDASMTALPETAKTPAAPGNATPALPEATAVAAAANEANGQVASALVEAAKVTLAKIGRLGPNDSLPFDEATAAAVRAWVAQNPQDVEQWLNTVPEDNKQREHTMEAMILMEISADPQNAFALANTITDDTVRGNRLFDVISQWAKADPAAATQAVQTANVADAERARLLTLVKMVTSSANP